MGVNSEKAASRYPGLDGLRAIAILLVFFYHLTPGRDSNQGGLGRSSRPPLSRSPFRWRVRPIRSPRSSALFQYWLYLFNFLAGALDLGGSHTVSSRHR